MRNDNCGLRFTPGHNIKTKPFIKARVRESPREREREHVYFVGSRKGNNAAVRVFAVFVFRGKNIRSAASFEVKILSAVFVAFRFDASYSGDVHDPSEARSVLFLIRDAKRRGLRLLPFPLFPSHYFHHLVPFISRSYPNYNLVTSIKAARQKG